MQDERYDELVDFIVESATEDHAGLWEIPWAISRLAPEIPPESVKPLTLRLVRELVEKKGASPGYPDPSSHGFRRWQISVGELIRYIDEEWERLGHVPDIGEVVWFHMEPRDDAS